MYKLFASLKLEKKLSRVNKFSLRVKNLSCSYDGIEALKNISFKLSQGEILSVTGHSGAGKSTLIKCISGKNKHCKGEVLVNDINICNLKPAARPFTVLDDIKVPYENKTVYNNIELLCDKYNCIIKPETLIDTFMLNEVKNRTPMKLSDGEKIRMKMAFAVAYNKKILLMDEPFATMDPALCKTLGKNFVALLNKYEISCIYITHKYNDILNLSNKAIVLQNGKVIQYDNPINICKHPATLYCARLMGMANTINARVAARGTNGKYILDIYGMNVPLYSLDKYNIGEKLILCISANKIAYGQKPRNSIYLNCKVKKYTEFNGVECIIFELTNGEKIIANVQPSALVDCKPEDRVFVWWNNKDVQIITEQE